METIKRIQARQTALETPLTTNLVDVVEHVIREAASLIAAAQAETNRDDASAGILAAKLADARHAIDGAAARLFEEAKDVFPIKDISAYGTVAAADDGDDYACGVIAMGEPICQRSKYLL